MIENREQQKRSKIGHRGRKRDIEQKTEGLQIERKRNDVTINSPFHFLASEKYILK